MAAAKRIIDMKVLPGQPLDGSGQVCIHFFIRDDAGPFVEPSVTCLKDVVDDNGNRVKRLSVEPASGRLACDPNKTVAPVTRGNVTSVTLRSGDARAVTCPKCKKTSEYSDAMELNK